MRTISFINLKGGVGKTVSAVNFAHILAVVHKKRVLLVDGDKQGNASQYFRLYGAQEGTAAILLNPALDALETIYTTKYKGLDVITSNMDLYTADRELYMDGSRDTAGALKAALCRLGDDYDYCVVDNGPAVDTVALNVLVASDDVMIPVRPDDFSFAGLADLAEQVERVKALNPGLVLQGAFFTHWQKRDAFLEAREALEKSGICPVFQAAISYNPKVSESTFAHEPICQYASRSWAAIQYKKLVAEYLGLTDSDKGGREVMKKENIPKCRECKYMKTPCSCLANANNRWRPRSVCYCAHPKAKEVFGLLCPRSPREPACIGFTPMGGDKPQIKTSPRWCPLRHPDLLQAEK